MPGCLRTGMWGVAWLESTEGRETDDFMSLFFVSFFIINKRVFLQNKTTYGS